MGYAKSKQKSIKCGNTPWALKQKRRGHSKTSEEIKKSLYNWIIHHPQVVPSPIANDCLKVKIGGYTEPQLVPNFLLQVSVRELHNNIFNDKKDGGLIEARDEDDNILISDSTLCSLFPSQFKIMTSRYKFMCGCEFSYLPKVCIHHYSHGMIVI